MPSPARASHRWGCATGTVPIFARAKIGKCPLRVARTFARRGPCASPPGAGALCGPLAAVLPLVLRPGDLRLQRGGRGLPRGGLTGEMLRVVHDGVEPGRVRSGDRQRGRQSLGLGEDRPLLLTVATLTDHKGHRFLLDAMPAVLREMPNVTLALAGDGELLDPLRQQAQRLGVLPHVRFLGYRSDVPDLMQAADVFVLPSHMEGLCTALIDAMLAPRTIVTTTAGGIPDLLGDNAGHQPLAWTVPPRDPPALARSILGGIAAPDASAAMRERARRRAEQHFTADCMVEATLSVFREGLAALQQPADHQPLTPENQNLKSQISNLTSQI